MRTNGCGIIWGCSIVLVGLVGVLVTVWLTPVAGVDSFERFMFVGGATGIPYAFGVLVGVSAVYHSRRRGRFLAIVSLVAAVALCAVGAASETGSIFSPAATSLGDHILAAVISVWVFLPLVGLFFGALAVTVGRRPGASPSSGVIPEPDGLTP